MVTPSAHCVPQLQVSEKSAEEEDDHLCRQGGSGDELWLSRVPTDPPLKPLTFSLLTPTKAPTWSSLGPLAASPNFPTPLFPSRTPNPFPGQIPGSEVPAPLLCKSLVSGSNSIEILHCCGRWPLIWDIMRASESPAPGCGVSWSVR